jgi:hypothetical protein
VRVFPKRFVAHIYISAQVNVDDIDERLESMISQLKPAHALYVIEQIGKTNLMGVKMKVLPLESAV